MSYVRTHAVHLALAAALLFVSAACVANTRAAIKNTTEAPISVTLTADGKSVTFKQIAPNATSPFQKLPFESLTDIVVKIIEGTATAGKVTFTKTNDNVVTLQGDAGPTTDSVKNPDNTFW